MESYECKCGKRFTSKTSRRGHIRWCKPRNTAIDWDISDHDSEASASGDAARSASASTTNSTVAKDLVDLGPGNTKSDDEEETVISYRCTQCLAIFESMEFYRLHYLTTHLAAVEEEEKGSDELKSNSNGRLIDESAQTVENNPAAEPRSYCKRCRVRILSSSDDEEDTLGQRANVGYWKRLRKSTNEGSSSRSNGISQADDAVPAISKLEPESTEDDQPSSTITSELLDNVSTVPKGDANPAEIINAALSINGASNRGDHRSSPATSQASRSSSSTPQLPMISDPESLEVVKELLKEANAISKPLKVIILNFFSGRRVNPHPAKGPIFTVRLGEKPDTITAEDGTQQSIMRETYVKLNYDTGQWEKIEKVNQFQ